MFSGRDLWRNGVFAHGGLLMAPGGFEQDGLLLKVLLSGGLYRYFAGGLGGERIYGFEGTAQVLPGWRIKRGDLEAKFFFGLDLEQHRLSPDDPFNQLQGRSWGLRFVVDLWYEPHARHHGRDGYNGVADRDQSFGPRGLWLARRRGAVLFRPEVAFFATEGYRHVRFGGHFTAMKTGNMEWTAAGGWARNSDRQSGPYVRLGMMRKL